VSSDHRSSVCCRTQFSTLPRKPLKPLTRDGPICLPTLSRTASLHTRSQSLIDVGRSGASEDVRKASLNALIEQRRRGISKLRGLIIPEKVSEVMAPSHTICDLPEIRSKDSILATNKAPTTTSLQRYVRHWELRGWSHVSHMIGHSDGTWAISLGNACYCLVPHLISCIKHLD
jgi:hypothetical protein